MPKKSIPDDFSAFPKRLKQLMNERKVIKKGKMQPTSQQDLAYELNVKRQTVSLYLTGQSIPDAIQIRHIAQFFGVSADWLLGLTETKDIDINVRSIAEYTGLSSSAINLLHSPMGSTLASCFNILARLDQGYNFADAINQYAESTKVAFRAIYLEHFDKDGYIEENDFYPYILNVQMSTLLVENSLSNLLNHISPVYFDRFFESLQLELLGSKYMNEGNRLSDLLNFYRQSKEAATNG